MPFYPRPAGMFSAILYKFEDRFIYSVRPFLMAKPFAEYYWSGYAENANESTNYAWDFYPETTFGGSTEGRELHYIDYQSGAYFSLPADSWFFAPTFNAYPGRIDDSGVSPDIYQLRNYEFNVEGTAITSIQEGYVVAAQSSITFNNIITSSILGVEPEGFLPLYSSKSFTVGGRYGDSGLPYAFTFYTGAEPWGDNDNGWWFGKNASHVDGMAQAFEKPQHPYQLNCVRLLVSDAVLTVRADVMMTCKVYKLNEIPSYGEENVVLPEEPGELICTGKALLTPTYNDENGGLITFTLYDEEGSIITPIIDYPILVAIDDYNSPEMDGLVDFSALVSVNDQYDEGHGELAYLKKEKRELDENGEYVYLGEYEWWGINNFFSTGEMKTGITIFIDIDNPYVTFENEQEDGQYLFPAAGGNLRKTWLDGTITNGIKFLTTCPSVDGRWRITCDGSESLPSWLNISLIDITNVTGLLGVRADVSASALPSGLTYREAVIKFEIPGDCIEYKFMQGTQPMGYRGDVNGDGNVSINDLTDLIDILLTGGQGGPTADVNADGSVNISDGTDLIDLLLGGIEPTKIVTGNTEFTVNGVTFKMMAVKGGTFAMGATRSQLGSEYTQIEQPVHMVSLSDYYIGQTEVTQALWQAVMGSNPSHFTGDLKRPVEMVSWNDCQQFITKLNQMTGMNFRMPTEAEWEFAARGGIKNRGHRYAGNNLVDNVAWYNGNAVGTTHPVGTKAPNELGIYDMSGNVYEYCQDWSSGTGYPSSDSQVNPTGPETGENRVIRGGSIDYGDDNCRVARRWGDDPTSRWKDQGLRLAL